MQEAFLVVHRKLWTFDGTSSVSTWLFGICLRVASAQRRKAHRWRERGASDWEEAAGVSSEGQPEAELLEREARVRLARVLDQLEPARLDQELALLEEARRLLATDAVGAFRVLQAHEARFVGGQLRIEREFLAVATLVRLGRVQEAEARARALEVQAPRTIYGERLDRILGRGKR